MQGGPWKATMLAISTTSLEYPMPSTTSAQLVAQLQVVSVVLKHVCEALPAEAAHKVADAVRATLTNAPPTGDDTDAAQAAMLGPLFAALRR
jgi:hypothetical protein